MTDQQSTTDSLEGVPQILNRFHLESCPVKATLFSPISGLEVIKESWIKAENWNNLCLLWRSPYRVVSSSDNIIVMDSKVIPKPKYDSMHVGVVVSLYEVVSVNLRFKNLFVLNLIRVLCLVQLFHCSIRFAV